MLSKTKFLTPLTLIITSTFFVFFILLLAFSAYTPRPQNQAKKTSYVSSGGQTAPVCEVNQCTFNGNFTLNSGDTTYESKDIVITRGTFTIAGRHTFNSLKIIDGANLTHSSLSSNEPLNSNKKVDLIINTDISLLNGGKIDVSGKGYPGGRDGLSGSGPGGGIGITKDFETILSGGGGAFRGRGGKGTRGTSGLGGNAYSQSADAPTTLEAGSGGGGVRMRVGGTRARPVYSAQDGASGGGRIRLEVAGKIKILSKSSGFFANGSGGGLTDGNLNPGGGAGGSIWVSADQFIYPYGDMNPITVNAGLNGNPAPTPGVKSAPAGITNFSANGGDGAYYQRPGGGFFRGRIYYYGGGGGGGDIHVTSANPIGHVCVILPGYDSIPAECENQDLEINGEGAVVNANKVKVWQSSGEHYECKASIQEGLVTYKFDGLRAEGGVTDCRYELSGTKKYQPAVLSAHTAGQSCNFDAGTVAGYGRIDSRNELACDSKRTFTNLTLRNQAVLTHEPITVAEMSQDTNGNKSLTDEPTSEARWKKVDLMVNGKITLQSDSKIDVTGKGYPGGQTDGQNGFGPSGGGAAQHGHGDHAYAIAGGGGSYGAGGTNTADGRWGTGGPAYPPDPNIVDYGSGGGHAHAHTDDDHSRRNGGAGGGMIKITATDTMLIRSGSLVKANGGDGYAHRVYDMDGLDKDHATAYSGGGGGGYIELNCRLSYTGGLFGSKPPAHVSGGLVGGMPGIINDNVGRIDFFRISADGGNGGLHNGRYAGGGGGGRLKVWTGTLTVKVRDHLDQPVDSMLTLQVNRADPELYEDSIDTGSDGEYIFVLPPNDPSDPNDRYIIEADPVPNGYSNATATAGIVQQNRDTLLVITVLPISSTINGDVSSKGNANLKSFQMENKTVIAAGGTISSYQQICKIANQCVELEGYNIDWGSFDQKMQKNKSELVSTAHQLGSAGSTVTFLGGSTWNLNSTSSNPSGTGDRYPEGGVWYYRGNLTFQGATTFIKRGTIIVDGTVRIVKDLNLSSLPSNPDPAVGIIAKDVIINSSANNVEALIYAEDSITIAPRTGNRLNFQGLMVTRGDIFLPDMGLGSNLTYNPFLDNKNRRPVPGFKEINKLTITPVAP